MKRRFLLALLAVAVASPLRGAPALFYVNDAVVQAPPEIPPQVDAINFVNRNFFSITFTNLDFDPATFSYNATLFQTADTLNFTNIGYMAVNPGINFLTVPSPSQPGQERMAANFYNPGTIHVGSDTNFVLVGGFGLAYGGLPQMRVAATNIFNPGSISVGYDGLCSFNGQTVDLSRGSLMMTNSGSSIFNSINNATLLSLNLFNAGVFDGYWGIGTNPFSLYNEFVIPPPLTPAELVTTRDGALFFQQLVLAVNGLSYTNVIGDASNFLVSAVFVNNTNSAFAPKVYFLGGEIVLEWSQTVTNADGTTQPQYLYVLDDFPDIVPAPVLLIDGFAGVGITRPTMIPENYFVFESPGAFFLGAPSSPSAIPPPLAPPLPPSAPPTDAPFPFFPMGDTTNLWTAYEALLPPISIIISDVAGQDVTNIPGRIEVSGGGTLDLTRAQITSLNYLSLQATNQFLGSRGAQIGAPFVDFNLRSTNGLLDITNLVKSIIRQPEGYIDLWSTCVTNVYVAVVSGTNFYGTNVSHVLFADAHVAPNFPVRSQSLLLTSTNALGGDDNLIIHDVFNISRNLRLDATRITIATNAPGASPPAGALYIDNSSIVWPDAAPRLEFLTNSGAFRTYNAVFFGGSRTSPFYNTITNVPYSALINRGSITNNGSLIWALDFENSGLITATTGDIQLQQAQYAILTNGFLFAVNGSIALNSGSLFASNTTLLAGAGLSLAVTNVLTDGISNLALIYQANPTYPTNYLSGQVTNGNVWSAGDGGISLLAKPDTGDLLGATISDTATFNTSVPIVWAGADLGATSDGFLNNAALGRLVLSGSNNSVFAFMGAAAGGNAIYVDDLELEGFTATANDLMGDFTGLSVSNITVYYAQARANGVEIAEKLNGRNGGGFVWVSGYNWGYFSSTNLLYPSEQPYGGLLYRVNAALASSCDLVSNTNNTVVNCQSQAPIWPVALPTNVGHTDVTLLPKITSLPQGQTVNQGGSATFSVSASSPWPLSYQWQLNSNNIAGAIYPSYTITGVQAADAGSYSVVVTTFAGSTNTPGVPLAVNILSPAIIAQPQSLTVAPGSTAAFSVTASGVSPLTYQWQFNGSNIAGATAPAYSKTNVKAADSGLYGVVVSNPFGSVLSASARLEVLPANPLAVSVLTPSPNTLLLTWPAGQGVYNVQVATNLTPPINWTTVTNHAPSLVGGQYFFTNSVGAGNLFLRLNLATP